MPTYDYICDACEHQFEEFQPITAAARRKCPNCGKRKLRRLIGPGAAIVFKGSGFYKTDYRSESYKKGEEAATKSDSGTGSGNASNGKEKSKSGSKAKVESGT